MNMVIIGSLLNPEEGLVKKLENVTMKINQIQMQSGVLYITENFLRWKGNDRDEGISIPWQSITLHAISNTPVKCIYIMLDVRIEYPATGNNGNGVDRNGDDDDFDDEGTCEDEEPEMTEIWFTPTDETTIESIFESMKHCQSLHPDANDSFSDEEDEFIMAEDNINAMGNADADLRNLHIEDDERFADAEEE